MVADEATSLEAVQVAEANLHVAEARVKSLHAQIKGAQSTLQGNEALLRYTRIYAPIAGTVVTLEAREGQTLNAVYQTPNLLRIADLSRMTVWTEVSEADVGRLRLKMPVYFTTLGLQDETGNLRRWNGALQQVLPAPPATTAPTAQVAKVVLYTALFDVDNADGALMPQMSAQVFFVTAAAHDVLVAPLAALEAVEGKPDAFIAKVLEGEQVATREVRIGTRNRLHGEVLAGLKENDALVTGIRRERASRRVRW
jgi:macrolide-specific efflux system membrane fusion protein